MRAARATRTLTKPIPPSGALVVYAHWSAAGEESAELEAIPATGDELAQQPAEAVEETPAPVESELDHVRKDLLGSPIKMAIALWGKPSLHVAGLGPFGSDEKYVFPLEEGVAAVISATDGVIVSVTERER